MAEYIKREDVLSLKHRLHNHSKDTIELYPVYVISPDAVEKIPSADVAEVRHGKWEVGLCYNHYLKGALESKCSICGSWNLFDFNGYNYESNFCPNCGARMVKHE